MVTKTKPPRPRLNETHIFSEYRRIITHERRLVTCKTRTHSCVTGLNDAEFFFRVAMRVLEISENSTVIRCGGSMGHLTDEPIAYESDGGHTNLVRSLMQYFLDYVYGWGVEPPIHTRRVIDEGLLQHDLPENETGDRPDNNPLTRATREKFEHEYLVRFNGKLYNVEEDAPYNTTNIMRFHRSMRKKDSLEGRGGYLADKTAAIFAELSLERIGVFPYAYPHDPKITDINRREMQYCELRFNGGYLLSELWTADFLRERTLTQYDDTGFFTALVVMSTLIVRGGNWYNWRKLQYLTRSPS